MNASLISRSHVWVHARVAFACLVLGCSTLESAEDDGLAGSAIVGGDADEEHTSVGLIRFVQTDEAGVAKTNNCTGTLVAPDIVLTAAHCVVPTAGAIHGWTVSFDAETGEFGEMFHPIEVRKALAHPSFQGGFGRFDVALLFLEKAPTGLRPMPIATSLGNVTGQKVTFVGYGATDENARTGELTGGNDRRRSVTVDVSEMSDTFIEYVGQRGLCAGDSGGPALMTIRGVETIVGTNDLSSPGCKSNGAALRVDQASEVRAFLAENIPGVEPPSASNRPRVEEEAGTPPPDCISDPYACE